MTDSDRPMRKDAVRNRELLIAAARDVFAERGLDASLDDVARAAGVGVGTAYRHFANKHELAKAVFGDAVEGMAVAAERAAAFDDPWQGIVEFLTVAAEAQGANRGLRQVLCGLDEPELMGQVGDRLTVQLRDLIKRAKDVGAVRADVEATDLGVVIIMLYTVADLLADDAPDQWRRYLPMLLAGLQAPVEPPLPPVDPDVLHRAMFEHKKRLMNCART